jgi:hypothetical protein
MWIDTEVVVMEDIGIGSIVSAGLWWPRKWDPIPSWQTIQVGL